MLLLIIARSSAGRGDSLFRRHGIVGVLAWLATLAAAVAGAVSTALYLMWVESVATVGMGSPLFAQAASAGRVAAAACLVAVVPVFRQDAAAWNWQFNVQKTKEMNAYCMPGGRIMVYSGLIENLDVSDAELATLEVPVLFIVGQDDPVFPPSIVRRAAARIPGAEVVEIANAGHSPYFERPDAWNAIVEEFLR